MKIAVADIETMKELFLIGVYIPEEGWKTWEVSRWKDEISQLVEFIESHKDYYFIFYNGLRFDSQVIEWIIRTYENWYDLPSLEICDKIYEKAQDVIQNANFGVLPEYRERDLSFKIIDLFEVHHFSNKNRMVSLKRLEFEMDLENIEEMPIHHSKEHLTEEEIKLTKNYCLNDVMATYQFYKVTTGDTSHPLYKGNNQIQLRMDIEQEFGIPCLNYSDSKIGDEIIKKFYCEEKKIEYNNLPKKGFFRKSIKVAHCIAKYIKFQTPELQAFLKEIKNVELGMNDDFKHHIQFYDNTYSFMKGGLHTENKPEMFEADDYYDLIDFDVSSMYPATIINNKKYPYHLGKEFLSGYEKMFRERLRLKPLAKNDGRIAGIVGAYKLSLNSVYGKTSDVMSWMYDRQVTMFTTITGELSLLMLIEMYELAGIHVISANTDGVTVRVEKNKIEKLLELNKTWCEITNYDLERTDYKKIIFSTVNDYLAIKSDLSVKKKGEISPLSTVM